MTPELILAIAGIVISLIFTYLPNLNEKYASLGGQAKRLIMLGVVTLVTAGIGVLDHFEFIDVGIDLTTKAGIMQFASAFIVALMSNQGAYLLAPVPQSVEQARAESYLNGLETRTLTFDSMDEMLAFLASEVEEDNEPQA